MCCVTFRTHRGLLRHNALVHKQLPRDASGRPFIQNNPAIPAGFHDLGFTDFSCRKFPRISQVRPPTAATSPLPSAAITGSYCTHPMLGPLQPLLFFPPWN